MNSSASLLTYKGHSGSVNSISLSPSGKEIASASSDKTIHIWEIQTGRLIATHTGVNRREVLVVSWSPDGSKIVSGYGDGSFDLWEPFTGKLIDTVSVLGGWGPKASIAWHNNSLCLYTSSSLSENNTCKVIVYYIEKSKIKWTGGYYSEYMDSREGKTGHRSWVGPVACPPNNKNRIIASGDDYGEIHLWMDVYFKNLYVYTGHVAAVTALSWRSDRALIVSGSRDGEVKLWTSATGKHLALPTTGITTLSHNDHTNEITSVGWSSNNVHFASASKEKTVQVWSAIARQRILTYTGHTDKVTSIAWLPSGNLIASASADSTVQIWKAL